MSSENDTSIAPETVVSGAEASSELATQASSEVVTTPLVSPVNVPSSARLTSVQSAYARGAVAASGSTGSLQCSTCVQLQDEGDKLVMSIEELVQGGQLTMLNIIEICLSLMTTAETIPNATGQQRKQLVLQAISVYLQKSGGDASLVNLLPPFIDSAIALEKGDVSIATQQAAVGCLGCLGFWTRKGVKKGSQKGSQKSLQKSSQKGSERSSVNIARKSSVTGSR